MTSRRGSSSSISSSSHSYASTNLTTPNTSPYKSAKSSRRRSVTASATPLHSSDDESQSDLDDQVSTSSRSSLGDRPSALMSSLWLKDDISRAVSPANSMPSDWFRTGTPVEESDNVDLDAEDKRLKELEKDEPLLRDSPDRFVLFPIKYPEVRRFGILLIGAICDKSERTDLDLLQTSCRFILDCRRSGSNTRSDGFR